MVIIKISHHLPSNCISVCSTVVFKGINASLTMYLARKFSVICVPLIVRLYVTSTRLAEVKLLKATVVCEDCTFEHGEPSIKGTFTFVIVDSSHCSCMHISMHQLATPLNKPTSPIPYTYSSIIVFESDRWSSAGHCEIYI
jgi:hypothetical protein